jgi:hypothetical protein
MVVALCYSRRESWPRLSPSAHLGWTGLDWIHVARLYDDDMETGDKQVQLMIFGDGEALVCLGCKRFIYHSHAGAHVGAHAEKSGAC